MENIKNPPKGISTKSWMFVAILSMLMACTSLSVDVYLPAMPKMQIDLQGNIELTITGFLIGFAVGQLVWGGISDRIGRRTPLLIGMILFIIGSIGCALSQNIWQIVFWRVFQALGACTGPMLVRAMIRDLYAKTRAAQMLSTLLIIMAIAPIAGPLIGGQIVTYSTWHNIFWLLVAIGIFMLLSVYFLPETLTKDKRSAGSLGRVFYNYGSLLKNITFMRYTLCVTFFYIAAYAFIVGSPFVYISYYGISEQHYGWLFALNIIGVMVMSFFNRKWVAKYDISFLLHVSTKVAMVAAIFMAIMLYFNIGGIYSIIFFMLIVFSMNGIVAACSTAGALDGVGDMAGSASALMGSLQYGSGIVSSILLALFYDGTPKAMIWIITISIVLCGLTIIFKPKAEKVAN